MFNLLFFISSVSKTNLKVSSCLKCLIFSFCQFVTLLTMFIQIYLYMAVQVKDRLKKMGHLQPLNIFLRQEIDRMQRVVSCVRNTLKDLKLAIDGTIIMSENLRDALDSMYDARIPSTWKRVSNSIQLSIITSINRSLSQNKPVLHQVLF